MDSISDKLRWLQKDGDGITRKEKLLMRQRIIEKIRSYFKSENFFEAEVPLLVSGTTPDTHIHSFAVKKQYLTTSTEYHIKRMIAGGFEKVYTLTKNFRDAEFGAQHNPEFTMLEWARVQSRLDEIENDAIDLILSIASEFCSDDKLLTYQNFKINLSKNNWQTTTFQDIFKTHYNIEIPDDFVIDDILPLAKNAGIQINDFFEKNPAFLLSELLDQAAKKIGFTAPVLIKKWPSSMTTSAELSSTNLNWTTRTEIIIAGIEIADGFPFLCDFDTQKALFEKANALRQSQNLPRVEYDNRYLTMLQEHLPKGAGMALGVDRLCMLFTNSATIKDVLCFSWDEL